MSLSPREQDYLLDMLEWVNRAQGFIVDVSRDDFRRDLRSQSAVLHALIVIGEAASRISDSSREALPEIPWYQIRGMRNRIAHDYVSTDLNEVWRTVSEDLPKLAAVLEAVTADF